MTSKSKSTWRGLSALQLFRQGHDTSSISKLLGISEAAALAQVSQARSAELHRADPYHHPNVPKSKRHSGLIGYAGRP
ncbi:hypothetical protein [Rhizobium subbaraonis]|uniref:hypothetical protein n=1 Tax=Rhizobium subbaraonis TaxID=908946 RepID=UPI0011412C56|nr:hypothetical protein [Rhizobium subbaraonis]